MVGRSAPRPAAVRSSTVTGRCARPAAKLGIYGNSVRGSDLPIHPRRRERCTSRRQPARIHADLRRWRDAAGQRVLVGDDVRRRTQLLIDNPINRYLINSPMLPDLKKNPDGSLTIYIQHDIARQGS